MAFRMSSEVSTLRRFVVLSVLLFIIRTTVSAPAPRTEENPGSIEERLNNPCDYNPHPLRHQRSLKNPVQRNYTHVQAELRKVKKLTNRTLKMFQKMYQNSTTLKWPYDLVPNQLSSKVAGYHGLQIFMKAIDLMSKQSFQSTNEVSAKKRSSNLLELLNKSTVLLCEIYDDIHVHNQTKEVLLANKNKNVQDVDEKIPGTVERTELVTQDREVLKKYKKFLRDLGKLYRQEKPRKQQKNNGESKVQNKPNKNNSNKGKKTTANKNKKNQKEKLKKKNVKRRDSPNGT